MRFKRILALILSTSLIFCNSSVAMATPVEAELAEDIIEEISEEIISEDPDDIVNAYHALPAEMEDAAIYVPPYDIDTDKYSAEIYELKEAESLPARYVPAAGSFVPTRNQGNYGTCWAHSGMTLAEQSFIKQGFETTGVDFSELQADYFMFNSLTDPLGGTAGDRNYNPANKWYDRELGSDLLLAANMFATWTGVVQEADAKYSEFENYIPGGLDSSLAYSKDYARLSGASWVSIKSNPELVKKFIKEKSVVATSYCDKARYFTTSNNAYYCYTPNLTLNHAITIVGWDDDYPRQSFSADGKTSIPENNGAWLIRNSWAAGTNYDDSNPDIYSHNTYFWMSYEDKSLNTNAISMDFERVSECDNNYQYDGGYYDGYYRLELLDKTTPASINMANVFKTSSIAQEELNAIAFATYDTNLVYEASVYKNPTNSAIPTSGEEVAYVSGNALYWGYYKVPLPTPVILNKGDKYSVVIRLSREDGYVIGDKNITPAVVYEKDCSYSFFGSDAKSIAGQSYVAYEVKSGADTITRRWSDFHSTKSTDGNVRVKAFTKNMKYGIEYSGNGSTGGTMSPDLVAIDASILAPACAYTKTGYTFTGWNTKANGSGDAYSVGDTLPKNSDCKLYAQWIGNPHSITLSGNGGLLEGVGELLWKDNTIRTGDTLGTLPTPKKDGEFFIGWYTQSENGIEYTANSTMPDKDLTLYAHWSDKDPNAKEEEEVKTVETYTMTVGKNTQTTANVTFDFDGAEIKEEPYTMVANGTKAKLNKIEKEGYKFKCWTLNGKKVTMLTEKNLKGDVTIKAVFAENVYTVTYKLTKPVSGVKFSSRIKAAKYNYTDNVSFPTGITAVDKTGKTYKLVGWSKSNGGKVDYTSDDKDISKLSGQTKKDKKIILYSVWEEKK